MQKAILLSVLVLVLAGCSAKTPTPTPTIAVPLVETPTQLSVEQYAKRVCSIATAILELERTAYLTWEEGLSILHTAREELDEVVPPEHLQEFHRVWTNLSNSLVALAESKGVWETVDIEDADIQRIIRRTENHQRNVVRELESDELTTLRFYMLVDCGDVLSLLG